MWSVYNCSIQGKSHKVDDIPCQDNSYYKIIDDYNMVIACVCDGAGSAENSDKGSLFCTRYSVELLSEYCNRWYKEGWPKENEWNDICKHFFTEMRIKLEEYAKNSNIEFDTLATTMICVIVSPDRIISFHIGDGRGAFLNDNNEWNPLFIPTKGEQVGSTIFLTSKGWEKFCEVRYFESKSLAFAIMTDGCESATFECYTKSETEDWYFDPNKPFIGFFDPMYLWLKENYNSINIQGNFKEVIDYGTEPFKKELDDKTMLFGIFL